MEQTDFIVTPAKTGDVRCALRDLTGRPVEIQKEGDENGQSKRQ